MLLQACSESQKTEETRSKLALYYEELNVVGFQVFVRKDANEYRQTKEAIQLLSHDLLEIKHLVSPTHFAFFQKVKIWIEWEASHSLATHYISSLTWIRRKGYLKEKMNSIEILSVKNYLKFSCKQPYMLLHELAHAYHDQVIGYEDCEILETYCQAMEKQLYDSVAYIQPLKKKKKMRAYAAHDAKEYFAELTESYFGLNDYYPFGKADLQVFDPLGFALMEKFWKK